MHVLWKGFRRSETIALSDWVSHGESLILNQVMIELPDPLQMAVDGLWLKASPHKEIDIM
jgi:hypothetical protein